MIGISGRMARKGDVVKPVRFDVLEKELHLTVKRRMVVLEGQDIIGSLLRNGLGNLFLTAHGVDCDNGTLKLQHPQELGNRRDFVRLVINFELT